MKPGGQVNRRQMWCQPHGNTACEGEGYSCYLMYTIQLPSSRAAAKIMQRRGNRRMQPRDFLFSCLVFPPRTVSAQHRHPYDAITTDPWCMVLTRIPRRRTKFSTAIWVVLRTHNPLSHSFDIRRFKLGDHSSWTDWPKPVVTEVKEITVFG